MRKLMLAFVMGVLLQTIAPIITVTPTADSGPVTCSPMILSDSKSTIMSWAMLIVDHPINQNCKAIDCILNAKVILSNVMSVTTLVCVAGVLPSGELDDLPPEKNTRYNIVNRRNKWVEKGIRRNKLLIS